MLQDSAYGATLCLPTESGGAERRAAMTGSGSKRACSLLYGEIRLLLENWSRWAATALPDLGVQEPPWADMYRPYNDPEFRLWDHAIPEQIPAIDERAAERVDKLLCPTAPSIAGVHVMTLKRHYIGVVEHGQRVRSKQPRDKLDAAIRALGDVL